MKDCVALYGNTAYKLDSFNIKIPKCNVNPKYRMPFCHQSVFVRTDVLKVYKFDTNFKICADNDFFTKLYNQGYTFYHSKEIISLYDAINKWIDLANDDIVCFLNADGFFAYNDVSNLIMCCFGKSNGVDVVYANIEYIDSSLITYCTMKGVIRRSNKLKTQFIFIILQPIRKLRSIHYNNLLKTLDMKNGNLESNTIVVYCLYYCNIYVASPYCYWQVV